MIDPIKHPINIPGRKYSDSKLPISQANGEDISIPKKAINKILITVFILAGFFLLLPDLGFLPLKTLMPIAE